VKSVFDLNFKAKKTKNKKVQPDYRRLRKERWKNWQETERNDCEKT